MVKLLDALIHPPTARHTASVIFLHGLGDTGHGWSDIARAMALKLPQVKWIFPHAPAQRVTLNMGMMMPAWYDILSLDKSDPRHDIAGILRSVEQVNALIQHEKDQGIQKIIVGGFSQGAAVSLSVLLTSATTSTTTTTTTNLSGIVALSGYLPPLQKPSSTTTSSVNIPIFVGHGLEDEVVQYQWGRQSAEELKKLGYNVDFRSYSGLGHSASDQELRDLADFLVKILQS